MEQKQSTDSENILASCILLLWSEDRVEDTENRGTEKKVEEESKREGRACIRRWLVSL